VIDESATFFEYAACSTCRKAKRWLDEHEIRYRSVPIVESPPELPELARLVKASGLPIERWFNTSGQSYRDLLARIGKEKFVSLPESEKLRLLSTDGKMIKRPVFVTGERVIVGFDEGTYASLG
jgi:arsenate reductase (glutaredoxin)